MGTWQFVDAISAAPTVRLDLNSMAGGLMVGELDVSPPPMRRVASVSMLEQGERISAAAYGNRTIRLTLRLLAGTADAAADILQALYRELARQPRVPGEPGNILRVQVGTSSTPLFFRTYPAPDAPFAMPKQLAQYGTATVELLAEPWGYGVKEVLSGVTVNNDPAAGSNGMFFDVSGIKGDVETPLYMQVTSGIPTVALNSNRRVSAIAVRRRGTVSQVPFFAQCESFAMQSADTTVQANDAAFSGSGSNWVRCTFATTAAHAYRMSLTGFPSATPPAGARGLYRAHLRYRWSATGTTGTVALRWGLGQQIVNDTVTLPATVSGTPFAWADLGMVQIPAGYDPVSDGISGTEIGVGPTTLDIFAGRTSGAGNLDLDVLTLMPADDRTLRIRWPYAAFTPTAMVIDSDEASVYGIDANGNLMSQAGAELDGCPPMVSPGVTNRIYFMRSVVPDPATGATPVSDAITETTGITPYYWPRYLTPVRPVSS